MYTNRSNQMQPFELFRITGIIRKLPKKESKSCLFLLEYKYCVALAPELVTFQAMTRRLPDGLEVGDSVEIDFGLRGIKEVEGKPLRITAVCNHLQVHKIKRIGG
ncbi:MAG: hypothetical protein ACQPRH_04770 [Solitalea-like symbiont of Tyrophagus putrescentiae]